MSGNLNQYLQSTMSSIPVSTIRTLKKDTNNLAGPSKKIKKDKCKKFLKEYKLYVKGDISGVTQPVTGKKLTNSDRINFIANQCLSAFDDLNLSNVSKSSSESSSSEDEIVITSFKDIDNIIEFPIKYKKDIDEQLKKIFRKPIDTKKGMMKLKKFFDEKNGSSTNDENIKLYFKILNNIQKYIPNYSPFMNFKDFNKIVNSTYYFDKHNGNSIAFILGSDRLNNINQSIIDGFQDFEKRIYNVHLLFQECLNEFCKAIMYSDNNKNVEDMRNLINNRYPKYYALEFMLLSIKKFYREGIIYDNAELNLFALDSLIENTFVISEDNETISLDKSPEWSNTPDDSNPLLKAEYKTNKENELKRIMDNTNISGSVNDADLWSMDEWSDMPLKKLRQVIRIPYTDNGKTFVNAYYAKSLYQQWYFSVKEMKPFINPSNRKPFSEDDKAEILHVMRNIHPNIDVPRQGNQGRSDLGLRVFNNQNDGLTYINIYYLINNEAANFSKYLRIYSIIYPVSFNFYDDDESSDLPYANNPIFLIDMMKNLMRRNKLLGKKIPFKPVEILNKYDNKVLNKNNYLKVFTELQRLL